MSKATPDWPSHPLWTCTHAPGQCICEPSLILFPQCHLVVRNTHTPPTYSHRCELKGAIRAYTVHDVGGLVMYSWHCDTADLRDILWNIQPVQVSLYRTTTEGRRVGLALGIDCKYILMAYPRERKPFLIFLLTRMEKTAFASSGLAYHIPVLRKSALAKVGHLVAAAIRSTAWLNFW